MLSVEGGGDSAIVMLLDGVMNGQTGDGGIMVREGIQQAVNHGGRHDGTGTVMHQNAGRIEMTQCLQAMMHRLLTSRSSHNRRRQQRHIRHRLIIQRAIIGMNHHLNIINAGVIDKTQHRMTQQSPSIDDIILLGLSAFAKASALTGGENEGGMINGGHHPCYVT